MLLRSIILDMGIGSEWWTRSKLKFYDGLELSILTSSITVKDSLKQNCFTNLPLELSRDISMRVEQSGCNWPKERM